MFLFTLCYRPEVWYNIKVLKAIQLTEIPLVKLWVQVNVMEGIIKGQLFSLH